jgi:hypothetical protein
MDLLDVLEVRRDRLPSKTAKAVGYAIEHWDEVGRPSTPEALSAFLDQVLKFCTDLEYRYPKVLLLKLKQLQRGEFKPRDHFDR